MKIALLNLYKEMPKNFNSINKLLQNTENDIVFIDDYTEIANTKIISKITKMNYNIKLDGKEIFLPCGLHIYPREYFSPKLEKDKWLTTENTHCIHHFTGMW